jgi:hypothetical protein
MLPVFHSIACRIGRHDLFLVKKISDQAGKVECNWCKKQWAMKFEGDNVGSMIPWSEAQFFYTDERIKRVLNSGAEIAPTRTTLPQEGRTGEKGS